MTDAPNTGVSAGGNPAPASGGNPAPASPPAGGAPAAPATVIAPWSSGQGVFTVSQGDKQVPWWNSVTEEPVRQFMEAKQYANPAIAATALYNANKLINQSADAVVIPGKDADQAAWDGFFTKLGRPEKPDGYNFKFDENVKVHEPTMQIGKEIFHMLGASPEKAQAAAVKWNEFVAKQTEAQVEAARVKNDEEIKALETAWGPDLAANKAAAQRVLQTLAKDSQFGITDGDIAAVEANIGAAAVVKLLAAIGRRSGEGTFTGGNSGGGGDPNNPATMSKEQAAARIAQLQGDKEFMDKYQNRNNPGHADALKTMEALFARR